MSVPERVVPAETRALTAALVAMADRRERPRCAEPGGAELWTSDVQRHRATARRLCTGCPVLTLCLDAAAAEDERWTVRGGVDWRDPHTRRAADRLRHTQDPTRTPTHREE